MPQFVRHWTCGRTVRIGAVPAADSGLVKQAAAAWNSKLRADLVGAVPTLVFSNTSPDLTVTRNGSGGGSIWCGATDPNHSPPQYISMGTNCPNHAGEYGKVVTHEFAHVLGFLDGTYEKMITPLNCVIRIEGPATLNASPCAQEVEFIFGAYGLAVINTDNIWTKSVVTSLTVAPHSMTGVQGFQLTDSVTSIQVAQPGAAPSTQAATMGSFAWESDNSAVASRSPQTGRVTTVTGVGAGSTSVRARLTGTSVSNAYLGTVARLAGDSVTVVVNPGPPPPPPGSGFRVTGVSGVTAPITTAGGYWLTPTVVNQPGEFLQLRWQVTYSNGALGPFDTGFVTGPKYFLQVPAGSYTITVTVTPRSNGIIGFNWVEQYPVCTGGGGGGGGDFGQAAAPEAGGSTDAVGGC